MTAPLSPSERRIAEGMRAVLRAKQRRQRERKPARPEAKSEVRRYGKRGWTWTP